jgi:hypothetical protein
MKGRSAGLGMWQISSFKNNHRDIRAGEPQSRDQPHWPRPNNDDALMGGWVKACHYRKSNVPVND